MITRLRKIAPKGLKRIVRACIDFTQCAMELLKLKALGRPNSSGRVYYLGVTEHRNLGDLAQHLCIKEWILANYPNMDMVEFTASVVVHPALGFVRNLKSVFGSNDLIVFQSGYTTQDLGGSHDLMHRMIIEELPDAPILMMPQTVFFKQEANRERTARIYNKARRMLFLARDRVSHQDACAMFPDIPVRLFPDIVTTRIGRYRFDNSRDRILLCCRNDSEKYYSDEEIAGFRARLGELLPTDISDTNSPVPLRKLKKDLKSFIGLEIEKFSRYRVTITDRYHGTIFSLAANTPVVIIKTTDHKVTTGAEWFEGVYDGYVHVAESLDHAFQLAREILDHVPIRQLSPHFEIEYYGKLKKLFEEVIGRSKV